MWKKVFLKYISQQSQTSKLGTVNINSSWRLEIAICFVCWIPIWLSKIWFPISEPEIGRDSCVDDLLKVCGKQNQERSDFTSGVPLDWTLMTVESCVTWRQWGWPSCLHINQSLAVGRPRVGATSGQFSTASVIGCAKKTSK